MFAIIFLGRLTISAVGVVSFLVLVSAVVLMYNDPMLFDQLAHQSHDTVPAAIDKIINIIKAPF